jgi:hypothetical protein
MKTLREVLEDAESRRVAVGHFNNFGSCRASSGCRFGAQAECTCAGWCFRGRAAIDINTEIRLAWRRGMDRALERGGRTRFWPLEAMKEVVRARLQLFNS